ncbi:MAG: V4R domain-containing protein [Nitrososphaerota archaeon]
MSITGDPAEDRGIIEDPILGGRVFMLSSKTFRIMGRLLSESIGRNGVDALLWNLGYRYGAALGNRVRRATQSINESVIVLTNSARRSGWGVPAVDVSSAPEKIVVTFNSCVFCEDEAGEKGSKCFFLAGILAGVAESIYGRSFKVSEIECRAAGAEVCKFVIEPS